MNFLHIDCSLGNDYVVQTGECVANSAESLYDFLESGYRLAKPENCPLEIFQVIIKCMDFIPRNRPQFSAIGKYIRRA